MGIKSSNSIVTHNADPQINIVNNQQLHSEILEQHALLFYITLVVLQLLITLYTICSAQISDPKINSYQP